MPGLPLPTNTLLQQPDLDPSQELEQRLQDAPLPSTELTDLLLASKFAPLLSYLVPGPISLWILQYQIVPSSSHSTAS